MNDHLDRHDLTDEQWPLTPGQQGDCPAARIAAFLAEHLSWTAFWDKRHGAWRVSENDPDSELYAVSREADTVIRYMAANS